MILPVIDQRKQESPMVVYGTEITWPCVCAGAGCSWEASLGSTVFTEHYDRDSLTLLLRLLAPGVPFLPRS